MRSQEETRARYDLGLAIGPVLGVVGFDDAEGASWRSFDITTYSQPVEPMIAQVTRIILDPAAFADAPLVVEGQLKVRESTRRATGLAPGSAAV